MYSSYQLLRKKTPSNSVGRKDFISQLVEEYHSTTNVEAQEQLIANLANFGYDPINFKYLFETAAINVFFHALTTPNCHLIVYATAGICNVCLDPLLRRQIIEPANISLILETFQSTDSKEVATNILTLFYFLLTEDKSLSPKICTVETLNKVRLLKDAPEQDLKNLCELFLQNFVTTTQNDAEKAA